MNLIRKKKNRMNKQIKSWYVGYSHTNSRASKYYSLSSRFSANCSCQLILLFKALRLNVGTDNTLHCIISNGNTAFPATLLSTMGVCCQTYSGGFIAYSFACVLLPSKHQLIFRKNFVISY